MDEISEAFKVNGTAKIKLSDFDTKESLKFKKDDATDTLTEFKNEMDDLQEKLYATNRYSLLIMFQAMDAGGKDSAIEHVMSGLNPQGCQVFSFKQPSAEELEHDFLWRHYKALPEKGRIGIQNRSQFSSATTFPQCSLATVRTGLCAYGSPDVRAAKRRIRWADISIPRRARMAGW